jgi:hypothetical protein
MRKTKKAKKTTMILPFPCDSNVFDISSDCKTHGASQVCKGVEPGASLTLPRIGGIDIQLVAHPGGKEEHTRGEDKGRRRDGGKEERTREAKRREEERRRKKKQKDIEDSEKIDKEKQEERNRGEGRF